ncbi:MAG: ATP-dependent helicase [Micromonosporaceae bacterium]|nr:ATP-dependent helicase [Micromonosporaceae bacterium]
MLVIHALWREGLLLWGEDSTRPRSAELPGRVAREAADHPFAAPAGVLAEVLPEGKADMVELMLPTRGDAPVDSPEVVREEPVVERGTLTLAPWRVPALRYDADDALLALTDLPIVDEKAGDVVLGAATRHLMQVAAFAADLVGRGRLLPTVDARPPRAVWRPLLTGPDQAWAQSLALALPPAGRAAGGTAHEVIAAALDDLVDAAARLAIDGHTPTGASGPARRPAVFVGADGGGTAASVVTRWRAALVGPDRRFAASDDEVAELAAALAQWQRDATAGSVRALFRLTEPSEDDPAAPWRLDVALQATDAPSVVVDAERIWSDAAALSSYVDDPQETLLAELGRASRLYPDLDDALRTAMPTGLDLDAAGAHRFLQHGAPMLAGAGFGVLLPTWWSRPRARLGVRLAASSPTAPGTVSGSAGLGLQSLVDYQWQLALGDEPLTEAELRRLATLTTPLVRLRGQWVELDPKRLAAGLKLIATKGRMTVAELLHAGLHADGGPAGLPVVSVTAEGALGELLAGQVDRRLEPVPTPEGFTGSLRPYQQRGLAWLAFLEQLGLGAILADDMGLGKSATILALLLHRRAAAPTLLVCPMSLVGNWQREVAKFAPQLRVHVHHGTERARGKAFANAVAQADLVITTYALAARDATALASIDWHRIVVDEAQAIKNAATRQAVAVRSLPARHRIAVTGTPVENRLADLWSIMEFTNPGLLGSASAFRARFAEPIERRADEAAAERLRRLTGPFVLRRVKTDKSIIADLPEKVEMEVVCNLTAEQASLYQAIVDDMMARIESSEGIERRGLVLATMTKLKQVCNHPAHLLRDGSRLPGRSGKLARLEGILDEVLAAGEKALLFTQFAEFGGMLRAFLSARFGREVLFLHGGVPKAERDAMVARFQSDDPASPPLFVLSLKAGGTGLTLTAANHVIHVDRWWNPAVEDQATDRAFRIGQTRNVQVHKFVCAGTVEQKIADMIQEKRGLAAKIVGTSENWITELSTEQLRGLFALESGAVVE